MDPFVYKETSMANLTITYRGTVYPWQCDHMGHMNVMWYVGKFDEASWQFISTLGLTRARFVRDGAGMATLEQRIEYKRELRAGDLITVQTRVLEIRDKTIRLSHEMWNDVTREVAARTDILGVYIDTTLRKACSLPSDVHARAELILGRERLERTDSAVVPAGRKGAGQPASESESGELERVAPSAMAIGMCW
jgi:acyl-CoA thioester hydrolase